MSWRPGARIRGVLLAGAAAWCTTAAALAQLEGTFFDAVDHPAITYRTTPDDAVTRLTDRLAAGTVRLEFDPAWGYLPSLLRALDISPTSQLVLFSKTSLQARLIAPTNPRSVYFNDATAVAWPRGGLIEIAAHSPRHGVSFYTLEQTATPRPQFARPPGCLTCHVSYATLNVPGMLVRSVATSTTGESLPHVWNGTTTHRTPLAERWAGWLVTGRTGSAHLGNATVPADAGDAALRAEPSTRQGLGGPGDLARPLTAHSDVAALLVFDHQMHMVNLVTRLGWEARVTAADRPAELNAVMTRAARDVVDYLLFVDEAPLSGPVGGESGFAATFEARGPRDRQGRSLRQLDLRTRLLRYPCSYTIYSEAFDALPAPAKAAVYRRLADVLSGTAQDPRHAHLSSRDRAAIREILVDTKPDAAPFLALPQPR